MDTYTIVGGNVISGEVDVQGSKNAVLPLMAAALVNKGTTVLHNCPDISDVRYMAGILRYLGCRTEHKDGIMVIEADDVSYAPVPEYMMKRVRASVLIMGAMLARTGYVEMDYPGGCMIGARPVDYHIRAMRELGVDVSETGGRLCCRCNMMNGADIKLKFPSVGATENTLIAACGACGATIIRNAAMEPEITELCSMLTDMGASIHGAGTDTILVNGKRDYHDVTHTVLSDRIVAGTYMCAGVITGGCIRCRMNNTSVLDGMTGVFTDMGCSVRKGNDYYEVEGTGIKPVGYIETQPYPGFPTDMQSQIMSVLSRASGDSRIVENIFEARFQTADELKKMGADITVSDNMALIRGVSKLAGARVTARELRGGASLIIAGLGADGKTVVEDEGYIKRGYEDIAGVIRGLGGNIHID